MSNKHIKGNMQGQDGYGDDVFLAERKIIR